MHWLLLIAALFFLFLFFPRGMLAIFGGALLIIPVALVASYLPDASADAEYWGAVVIAVLCFVPGTVWGAIYLHGVVSHWFTPHQGRLLYFLMFIVALIAIDKGFYDGPTAHERASPAFEKALEELAPVAPSPLAN